MMLELTPFKSLIRERCGLLLDGNAEQKLQSAILERISLLSIKPEDYFVRLSDSEAEFLELVNLVTINETYFFREPDQIRLFVDCLAPRFLAEHNGIAPVRILSAGCSSGEEPYSLAMALMDRYGESTSRLFFIAGCDIDSVMLDRARRGNYGEFSFRGVPSDLRNRYFDKTSKGNAVKANLKDMVRFYEVNLLSENCSFELFDFDIIFFRNVSIYFDKPTRIAIQHNLASMMKKDGVLVIGTAETLANDLGVLKLVEENGLFYFVKGSPPLPHEPVAVQSPIMLTPVKCVSSEMSPPVAAMQSDIMLHQSISIATIEHPTTSPVIVELSDSTVNTDADIETARQFIIDKRYEEALDMIDVVLKTDSGNIEALLLKAFALLNRKEFASADALLYKVLDVNVWSVDALLLLGLSAKWHGQDDTAIKWLKQAVYACQECWPAHYYLSELYRNLGEIEPASRCCRVVIQLLSGEEKDAGIKYVPLSLPAGDIRFICERHLSKISADSHVHKTGVIAGSHR